MNSSLSLPRHVAIIPDGNRRWATQNSLSVFEGHNKGKDIFREIALHAAEMGVEYLSIWGLSVDNFIKRTPREVNDLLGIFRSAFEGLLHDEEIHRLKVRVRVIGQWRDKMPAGTIAVIDELQQATQQYTDRNLTIFLAYDGPTEMTSAMQAIATESEHKAMVVTPEVIKKHLWTAELPAVDLLIRTGGEPHLSAGFMMWDMADAELFFTDTLWPAFTPATFDEAIEYYAGRDRRRGK